VTAAPDEVDLFAIPGCFDGVIPPVIATSSAAGEPNVTHLSQLYLVDREHVAASNQFFAKTQANVAENPVAAVLVTDSQTYDTYHLDLRFERTETSGPLFDELRASIDAIAVLMDMTDVFALRGADIYRVMRTTRVSVGVRR
jgi:pyridoxamine 5'-phosphate oxidase-like protein